jgi:L-threonylcarbamoyladenylate synthase
MDTMRFGTEQKDLQQAAELLRQGETVAFPTETVYGLGATAFDKEAVEKIFKAKGRPGDNPLIVHIAHHKDVDKVAREVPEMARRCMEHFWPGPLTLILPCRPELPANVTAGLDTVGVRMPDHPTASAIISLAGQPIAAPSANRSGRPSPTTAEHVWEDLGGRIAGLVDGGASGVGVESTVLDCTGEVPMILRPGSVTQEMLTELLGEVRIDPVIMTGQGVPKSPGVKYTHYAPKGEMWLVDGPDAGERLRELAAEARQAGRKVGVLTTEEGKARYEQAADVVIACGRRDDLRTVAAGLYDAIRAFDHAGAEIIYGETFPEAGMGVAIMNRLRKAAGHRVIRTDAEPLAGRNGK